MDPLTPASFRAAFPAFADPIKYPDEEIQFYISMSALLMDASQWGDLLPYGQSLFVAHNLALDAMSASGSAQGGVPGQVVGPVTSASVDKVSYGRSDPSSAYLPSAGHWNLTTWGMRYYKLMMMVGAKPLSPGFSLNDTNFQGPAGWPGVIVPTVTP